ncbi:MAG: aminotransferase class III-fold pyridoxal phosphate-dependent enzyme [Actinobacteria bacterium]|nr:aminotransferase class III-fold pyridoxal phosphate-dependent enzyme [Actinomycetota bacterium]MCB9389216.1 aminotransferase class III-fold pyridoxal phosphate-dependent enzyme [Acidimicrobiia bacterium]
MTGYALDSWPDTDQIYAALDALVRAPLRPLTEPARERIARWFDESCPRSRELTDAAKEVIPGGVQHNLAFNHPFPIAIARAAGAMLWDVDDNEYIDFLQAGGPTLLGTNHPSIRTAVNTVLDEVGPATGLFHEYEYKLAAEISRHMPAVEMFRMLGSGTEGVMAAIRLARVHTEKQHIIKIGGAYHGWSDQMVFGLRIPGTGAMEAAGIPSECLAFTQEVPPNDLTAVADQLEANVALGGTAAIIVEPIGPESGTRPVTADYNAGLRALCDSYQTLLIFDEVVSGFRMGLGGAQGFFDVAADLTVFGKCVAGGYPGAGGLGGRADIMTRLAAGLSGSGPRAFVGGTLSANPLSCAAGYHAIVEMERTDAPRLAGAAGKRLSDGLARIISDNALPYVAYGLGSIVHLQTSGVLLLDIDDIDQLLQVDARKHMMEEMGAALTAHGMITLAGSRLYCSMADTDEVIDEALNRFETVLTSTAPLSI